MKTHTINRNDANGNFIRVELQIGATHCQLAAQSDAGHLLGHLNRARVAHENVIRYVLRANLRGKEFNEITAAAERLKFALEALEGRCATAVSHS